MKKFLLSLMFITALSNAQTLKWGIQLGDNGSGICTDAVVDASGNVYAVGLFKGSVDFDPSSNVYYINELTSTIGDIYCVKYNRNGQMLWAKSVGGADNYSLSDETTPAIALDASGNIYIAGHYRSTVDMDPGAGTLFLPGYAATGYGNFICKLTNSGSLLWSKHYGGHIGFQFTRKIRTDASGNVYLAGYYSDSMSFDGASGTTTFTTDYIKRDGYLAKFDTNGNFTWAFTIGNSTSEEYIRDMDIDPSGNLLVTGSYRGSVDFDPRPETELTLTSQASSEDIYIAKYDGSTTECLWAKTIGETGSTYFERGDVISSDASGNVICAGLFRNTADFDPAPGVDHVYNMTSIGTTSEYFLKLTSSGDFVWAKAIGAQSVDGVYNYSEKAYGMTTDSSGSIYITGDYVSHIDADPGSGIFDLTAIGGSYTTFLMRLDANGDFAWAESFGPDTNKSATGRVVRVNGWGEVIAAGRFQGPMNINPNGTPTILNGHYPSYDSFILSVNQPALGISEAAADKVKVYPNPFENSINIDAEAALIQAEVFDVTGRIVISENAAGSLKTENLASGSYILKVAVGEDIRTFKIIKK